MTDLKAAGYVLGFHDAFAQHLWGRSSARCMPEIQESYKLLFGQQAGHVLFTKSMLDQEKPEFQQGRQTGGMEMVAYIERGAHPLGLMNHLFFGSKTSEQPSSAFARFEQAISSWDPGQAKIAVAALAAIVKKDREPLESMFGKGASIRTAIGHLTVGHVKALNSALEGIAAELGINLDEDEAPDE
jgi:hypothetical protein